ncbi:MAG TPA: transglutaminase-like domain-containing protein [Xanthobacteraceae bacterium]|jgi:transglutaminase-like putative cysteine protease|nr:transglutaminase-like domain-containing protein [Xanthobacteraceae bacterium]
MHFNRRDLLKAGAVLTFAPTELPTIARADVHFAPAPGTWRDYQVTTHLEIAKPAGISRAWIPLPSVNQKEWIKSGDSQWTTNGKAATSSDRSYGAKMLHVVWTDSKETPTVEVTSRISIQDRAVDLTKPGKPGIDLTLADRKCNTAGSALIPVGGIVKQTSDKITTGKRTEVDKVRAIYEWMVENTFRDAKVRGCGIGDITSMLKTGNLGGKCADLNALFVGLVRAAGIPARDIYGVRVAPSRFGFKSLGANSEVVTKAQHCRSEVFLTGYGWTAIDPADVRKVMLEEPPTNLAIDNPKVAAARETLFGAWEGNWLAYNFAHDLALPGFSGPKVAFLMYPQGETGNTRLDCLDADNFKYMITSKELTAA